MILTGKCIEEFLKKQDCGEAWFDTHYMPIFQNTLIVEWFDSVGIYISIECYYDALLGYNRGFEAIVFDESGNTKYDCNPSDCFETRLEAINKAIEKANEIYNKQ